jgi:DNA-binding SARP family transcriptional activator
VSTGRLIDVVWGEHAPRTAVNALQYHVSYLRRLIGAPDAIRTRGPGYLLDLGDDGVDAAVAERLVRHATQLADPGDRAGALQAALAMWHGQPLSDVVESSWMDAQAERLIQLRVDAQVSLAEAWLALGRHHDALTDLGGVAHEYPLHEPVHALLILALYRAGRQRDALTAYGRLRHGLDELGVEPSTALRGLQTAVLRQDPALDLGGTSAAVPVWQMSRT